MALTRQSALVYSRAITPVLTNRARSLRLGDRQPEHAEGVKRRPPPRSPRSRSRRALLKAEAPSVDDDLRLSTAALGGPRVGLSHEARSQRSLESQINPFYWTLQHRMAWLIVSVTGAIAGVLFAYIQSP